MSKQSSSCVFRNFSASNLVASKRASVAPAVAVLAQLSDSNQDVPKDLATLDLDEDEEEVDDDEPAVEVRGHKRRGDRPPIPPAIERCWHEHHLEGEDRICSTCGLEKTLFGHETCKILDFEPGRFVLNEPMLEKLACRPCGDGVVTARVQAPTQGLWR